jgi:hypothetical protein
MKAQKLKVIKPFLNKVEGQTIAPPRLDVAKSLVDQGYCEWVTIEVKEQEILGNQKLGEPIVIEPKKEENDNSNIQGTNDSNGGEQSPGVDKQRRSRKGNKAKA